MWSARPVREKSAAAQTVRPEKDRSMAESQRFFVPQCARTRACCLVFLAVLPESEARGPVTRARTGGRGHLAPLQQVEILDDDLDEAGIVGAEEETLPAAA